MMNSVEWFIRFTLPRNFSTLEFAQNGRPNTYLYFEQENSNSNSGYHSEILTGRVVYKDESGDTRRSPCLLVKVLPRSYLRSTYTELIFINEIFVYTKILPFYASLNDSIENLFPKFRFSDLAFGENEYGSVVLENLRESEYRLSECKIFLDIRHLSLMMKKLGEFHAYSYFAKSTQPEKFYSLINNLIESHFTTTNTRPNYIEGIQNIYIELISHDERYAGKVEVLEKMNKDADKFCQQVFTTRNEPVAVLCHGDFVGHNVLFKYDDQMNPIDMKFIDVANMRYCTPVVDLGLVLCINADQQTRDEYWDQLLDVYYESLSSTFPQNVTSIPTKEQVLSEFKCNILQPYLFSASFLPFLLEEQKDPDWSRKSFLPEYEHYVDKPPSLIPTKVMLNVRKKIHKGRNSEIVLDVLKDILNKNFL